MYGPTGRDWLMLFVVLMLLGAGLLFVGQVAFGYLEKHVHMEWR